MKSLSLVAGRTVVIDHPANNFVLQMLFAYYICCIYSNARLDLNTFIMEASTMNSDQIALKGGV